MTKSVSPLPKLRVTRRSCGLKRPHEAQRALDEVDRDDVENTREADLDDSFRFAVVERTASDDNFGFMGFDVFLSFNDLPCKEDVFEVEDRQVVIFQFFSSMKGYDIVQRANKITNPGDSRLRHFAILLERLQGA